MTSIIFVWIYSKPGLLNYLLNSAGVESNIDWLTNPVTVLPSIMMLNIWTTSGYFMVSFLAGLQNIPASLYEAAKIDGASQWQQFWKITVPMVRPVTYFVVIMSLIGCFQVFDQIFIMSSGGPDNASTTMSYFVYQNFFQVFPVRIWCRLCSNIGIVDFCHHSDTKKIFSTRCLLNRYSECNGDIELY